MSTRTQTTMLPTHVGIGSGVEPERGEVRDLRAEVLARLTEILDKYIKPGDLESIVEKPLDFDYVTNGYETHLRSRIVPTLPRVRAECEKAERERLDKKGRR